ncbi:MAG: hypothetical protein J6A79_02455 [Clostridia bacterium]|nr:hypothetical protein [Clostridia bacterium]
MHDLPDHPIVANLIRTGYPDGKEPTYPRCPICGEECDTLYEDRDGMVFACDNCVSTKDAWDAEECFPAKE